MQPISPVCPNLELPEVVYAKDQPEYLPLPSYKTTDGRVLTRWRLTLGERIRVFLSGDVYLQVLTFNRPLQPVKLTAEFPLADIEGR